MFETLIGEGQYGLKFGLALVIVLGLIVLTTWLVRRFSAKRPGPATARGRQRRLAVIDAVSVDGRRRIVLLRRDNFEHLMMIGGPTDVVVEANIVHAPTLARHPPPVETDTLPTPAPLGEGSTWPLQPQPATAPLVKSPALITAPQLHAPAPLPAPAAQGSAEESLTPPLQPAPQRRATPAQRPLMGLVDELARMAQPQSEPATSETRPARREPRMAKTSAKAPPLQPTAAPPAGDAQLKSAADQDLAEMTQRIETALGRPAKAD